MNDLLISREEDAFIMAIPRPILLFIGGLIANTEIDV
jgi:hypothetical protein